MCQSVSLGYITNGLIPKKLSIDQKGRIDIYELDPKTDQQTAGGKFIQFTVDDLRQVIYGRLSDNDLYQISFIIERKHSKSLDLDLHQEDLQFLDKQKCRELVAIVNDICEKKRLKQPKTPA